MANTLNLGDGNWATREDYLLGYNSENNNFKPLPFDFTRSSSATRIKKNGLIETINREKPRIDFLGNTKGTLLLEPQRTNLVLTSASGTYGNSPASEANTTSPDGTNNAVIPIPDSTSDRYGYSISSGAYATNTKLAYSWYRKRISTPIVTSFLGDLEFKILVNVTQVGSTTQIQSDVNGFDRFQAIFNITDGSASSIIRGYFGNIVGAGNSSVAYFGHQIEVGEYATSYIPTVGSAATRIADVCKNAGNEQVFNDSEGVLYVEISALANDLTHRRISISDGSLSNIVYISFDTASNRILANANGKIMIYTVSDETEFQKIAVYYNTTAPKLFVNGVLRETETTMNAITGLNELSFHNAVDGNNFYGNVRDVRVYNNALTNDELEALTGEGYDTFNALALADNYTII